MASREGSISVVEYGMVEEEIADRHGRRKMLIAWNLIESQKRSQTE
ncbi:MAG: hypothetical protein LAO76_13145 [Acidobacteriia bacterium]|nr:hypothetical protein [Terriglobia bacterium]